MIREVYKCHCKRLLGYRRYMTFLYFQSGKHDAIVKNVHDLLAKLAWDFSPEQLDHLFECFQVGCYFLQWHAHPVSSQVQLTLVIVCITYPQSQTHHSPSISSIEGKSPAEPEDCCLQGVSHGKYRDPVVTQYEFYKYPIRKMQIPNIFNNYTKKHLFLHTGFALHTSYDIKKQSFFI